MPAKKYLAIGPTTGAPTEEAGVVTSAGVADDGKLVALNSAGTLDLSVFPAGVGPDTVTATASEALVLGDLVNLHGTGQVRKAIATALGTMAHGYVTANVANAGTATVYKDGTLVGLAGLTPGSTYFLGETTAGTVEIFSTLAVTPGHIVQRVGVAKSPTELVMDINEAPLVRA